MNKEPETYEELIRQKRCVDLASHYELTENELNLIYDFLLNNPNGEIVGNQDTLTLKKGLDIENVINAKCNFSIDGLSLSNSNFQIIPHYTPSSDYSSSGGSSSNNNNNNNNNNNR